VEFKKDEDGKVTGEIKVTHLEASNLVSVLRYYKTHCLSRRKDHYYDHEDGFFDATLMKGLNDSDKEENDRLIRQMQLLQYELCPIEFIKDNFRKLGQTGAEN
jgi:hypothetical protein